MQGQWHTCKPIARLPTVHDNMNICSASGYWHLSDSQPEASARTSDGASRTVIVIPVMFSVVPAGTADKNTPPPTALAVLLLTVSPENVADVVALLSAMPPPSAPNHEFAAPASTQQHTRRLLTMSCMYLRLGLTCSGIEGELCAGEALRK